VPAHRDFIAAPILRGGRGFLHFDFDAREPRGRGLPGIRRPSSVWEMANRLSELARQRALLAEHLAWLDREIADETVKRLVPRQSGSATASVPTGVLPSEATGPTAAGAPEIPARAVPAPVAFASEPAEILDQYRVNPTSVKQDVRKGCLLYFAAAFLLLGLVVAILYFTIGTRTGE
jgi:hypothetical protein